MPQRTQFIPCKRSVGARGQVAESDRPHRHALEPLHFVPNAGEQTEEAGSQTPAEPTISPEDKRKNASDRSTEEISN